MRVWALSLGMIGGCFHAGDLDTGPDEPAEAPDAVLAHDRETALPRGAFIATDPKQTLFVAGCNTGCVDCGLGGYKTFIIGKLERTGARMFPTPFPPQAGYSCGAEVAVGERVTLIAHSPEGFVIDSWSTFFAGDACPCAGTQSMKCTFEVTAEIASRYDRIYCGAAWKQHATAQIGH